MHRSQGSMMASSWNLQCFLNQRLTLRLLTLVLAVIGFFSVTEGAAQKLRGEVGQNVTFTCPFDRQKTIKFFYLQRGTTFVNGYHALKNVTEPIWENTRLEDKTTVHMFRLHVSHSGNYDCVIQYNENQIVHNKNIHLSVTANYSKPTVTIICDKNHRLSCLVTCVSQGGYPRTKMMWNVAVNVNTSSQMWKVMNSSEETDPDTLLVNSSSTASFNCSYGMREYLSCSVGDITSEMFSVCEPQDPTDPNNSSIMVAAICVVVAVVIMLVSVLLWRCKKTRQIGAGAGAVRPEEVIVLNGNNGGEEAS